MVSEQEGQSDSYSEHWENVIDVLSRGKKPMGGSIVEQKISHVVSVSGDSQPQSVSQKRPPPVLQTLKRNISP